MTGRSDEPTVERWDPLREIDPRSGSPGPDGLPKETILSNYQPMTSFIQNMVDPVRHDRYHDEKACCIIHEQGCERGC